jgi:hypothetical protein
MADPINVHELRKRVVEPESRSMTQFVPFVEITVQERDALLDALDAAYAAKDDPWCLVCENHEGGHFKDCPGARFTWEDE